MGISIFAKKAFYNRPGHLTRVSSIIRGDQIAEFLQAKLNPSENYQNDVCIYVKPPYKPGSNLILDGTPFIDVVDSLSFCQFLQQHSEVGVISLSEWNYQILKKLLPNKITNIPQQNCNFERQKRLRQEVETVGIIGAPEAFGYLPSGLEEELQKRGMKLYKFSNFATRDDIVNFYLSIDVQVVWRPYYDYTKDILVNPLKIVNASSFGIPTIAYREKAFEEVKGCYLPVHNLEEFLKELDDLRSNPILYDKYAQKCLQKAEEYHIEKIAKLYETLN